MDLLEYLLSKLHEELNSSYSIETLRHQKGYQKNVDAEASSMPAWRAYTNKHSSVIVDLFHGQLGSALTCLECGKTLTSISSFSHLSLPLATTKTRHPLPLLSCIEEFLQRERLTDH